jgi:hypothetical protein
MSLKTKVIDIKTKEKIWNDKEKNYNDQELEQIREWLYAMAEVIVRVSEKVKQQTKVIPISTDHENKKSNYLRPSEHRRAS